MTKIFIYDTEPNPHGIKRLFAFFDTMRYMVLSENEYPWGSIVGYGRTPKRARQNAIKKLRKQREEKKSKRTLVCTDEVEL